MKPECLSRPLTCKDILCICQLKPFARHGWQDELKRPQASNRWNPFHAAAQHSRTRISLLTLESSKLRFSKRSNSLWPALSAKWRDRKLEWWRNINPVAHYPPSNSFSRLRDSAMSSSRLLTDNILELKGLCHSSWSNTDYMHFCVVSWKYVTVTWW